MHFNEITTPEQLLKFMGENISYGYISNNNKVFTYDNPDSFSNDWIKKYKIPTGNEVLKNKVGLCWCQTELEREWFKNHGYNYKTYFMWFELNRENEAATHTFLTYKLGSAFYWFENSWDTFRGIHRYSSEESMLEDIKNKHIKSELNNRHITEKEINTFSMYQYETLPYGKNGLDFINTIINGKKIIFDNKKE